MRVKHSILPYFKISFAYTIFYLLLLVILPLCTLVSHAASLDFAYLSALIFNDRVFYAFKLTFSLAALAAFVNTFFGLIIGWSIVRYNFFGKSMVEAIIDLPLALPTAVAGITLATLYSPDGAMGQFLSKYNIQVSFTNMGILVALIFVGLPIAIRTIEPIIHEMDTDVEAAAESLGASKWQIFWRIYLPQFFPAIISAFSICFARALSEYGAVIFISSNIPKESEVLSLLIYSKIEQFDYNEAAAIALIMLLASFIILWTINFISKKLCL